MRPLLARMQPIITVVTHISSDVSQPSVLIHAKDGKKYLFGRIGEGFQRSLHEHSIRSTKLAGIFLTGPINWQSVSGIPGFLLSMADRQATLNQLHTGPGRPWLRAQKMVDSWQKFTFHTPLNIELVDRSFEDESVTVVPISLGSDDGATTFTSTSYAVQMRPVRGKFDVARARHLGVPPGKLYAELSSGRSVQIPGSDKVVTPEEVLGPSQTPTRVLILDLPTMDHIRSALESDLVSPGDSASRKRKDSDREAMSSLGDHDHELRAVFYFFGKAVDLQSEEVYSLVSALATNTDTKQYISHPSSSPDFNTLTTMAEFQSKFRSEFPSHFSQLYSRGAAETLPDGLARLNCVVMQQQHTLSLVPREQLRDKKLAMEVPAETPESAVSEQEIQGLAAVPLSELQEPEVVTLGTGASAPSKYRNVSGTLVRSNAGSFIFDCGEATFNTLGRIYGPRGRAARLAELKILYVSHMHADHHLGALQLLKGWLDEVPTEAGVKGLKFLGPTKMLEFLQNWAEIDGFSEQLDAHVELINLESVCVGRRYSSSSPITHSQLEQAWANIGFRVTVCKAVHCMYSYSVSVRTLDQQFKVSYSGDTRPNAYFADVVGTDSDLLIHEATHENDLAEEASKKRHSTIGEALTIASRMRAKNTVLTHISQRYPQLPTIGNDGAKVGEGQYACFGFDAMHTYLSQIRRLQDAVPRMGELLTAIEAENNDLESDS